MQRRTPTPTPTLIFLALTLSSRRRPGSRHATLRLSRYKTRQAFVVSDGAPAFAGVTTSVKKRKRKGVGVAGSSSLDYQLIKLEKII